jgi:putative phosphoribosyl transferase
MNDILARLDEELFLDLKEVEDLVVLAISKRAKDLAKSIASKYNLECDILFIEEVKSPINKEVSLASVSESRDYVIVEELVKSFNITDDFLFNEIERVYEEKILEDIHQFRKGEGLISIKGKSVLLVDIGANTGLTLLCGIKSCINQGASFIKIGVGVIAKETAEMVEKIVDKVYFGKVIEDYVSTEFYIKESK